MIINEILHFGRSAVPIFNPKFKENNWVNLRKLLIENY